MMTRDNYEEWFLLYADNELTGTDRQVVERFVAGNPDLEEELQALLQCRLDPEDAEASVVFDDKQMLMRYAKSDERVPGDARGEAINDDNYEGFFVQYIDGELDGGKRQEVEEFIRRHPSRGAELEILQQTVSRPDMSIGFPDKEGLYKRTAGRRIVLYPWWKMAAAAVVLGVAAWLIFYPAKKINSPVTPGASPALYSSDTRKGTGVEKTNDSGDHKKTNGPAIAQQRNERPAVTAKDNGDIPTPIGKPSDKHQSVLAQTVPVQKATKGMDNNPGHEEVTGKEENGRNGQQKGDPGDVKNTALNGKPLRPEDNAITAGVPQNTGSPQNNNGASFASAVIPREKSSFATQALLSDATTSADDNSDTEPASSKKSRLRGFFRKVSRAFEKTADRGEESQKKILIGSFQIALN